MRDVQMREQASLIQKEVETLLVDINRLMNRVGELKSHFDQASKDIDLIEKSSNKIGNRSEKISDLELGNQEKIKDSNV
jgi:DNA recombination protein RmuC